MSSRFLRKSASALLSLVLALNAGCAAALIVGAAAGAGAAGYMYYNGVLYREFPATLAHTRDAVRAGLADLEFPITNEKTDTGTAFIQSRTAEGHAVRIYLNVVTSSIPAEGAVTRVSIRVGFAGDERVSARILDQVTKHLPAGTLPPPAPGPMPPQFKPPEKPPETAPPPVAPPAAPAKK